MKRIALFLVVASLVAGVANAAPTTVTDTVSFSPTRIYINPTLNWLHDVDFGTPPDPSATLDIQSAFLEIRANLVNHTVPVTGDGLALGNMGTSAGWLTTHFDLTGAQLDALDDGELAVVFNASSEDGFSLEWSKLSVTYDWVVGQQPPQPPQDPVPAPGAVVLASLGAGLVGWIRRRRSL